MLKIGKLDNGKREALLKDRSGTVFFDKLLNSDGGVHKVSLPTFYGYDRDTASLE